MEYKVGNRQVYGFCKRYFNKLVMEGWNVVRLIGYAEDEQDCYYIIHYPERGKSKEVWHSAVGGLVPLDSLHGQDYVYSNSDEHWDAYTRLDSLLKLNGVPEVEKFKCIIKE